MATVYPTAKDTFVNPSASSDTTTIDHAAQHTNANDALTALENKVGIDNSGDTNSLDYKVVNSSSINPGHKHTLAAISDISATATEVNYLSGVASNVQTQLNGKQSTVSLTASRAIVTDGSGNLTSATTTSTEIGYVNGVTSAIQTQLNAKEPTITTLSVSKGGTGAGTLTGIVKGNGTSAFTTVTAPTGALVGDTDSQTLSNKTLTKPLLNGSTHAYTVNNDGATITFDLSASNWHSVILGGSRTLAISNLATNQIFMIDLIQDGTGSRTVTWFASNSATATMTIATPAVVTSNLDIPTLTPVIFTTTGALPTGVTAGTTYYWVRVSSTTGNIATSVANAQAGTVIATSGSQSGTHTLAVQIRWQGQAAPTLSTGKYIKDSFGFKCTSTGIIDGIIMAQGV